MSTFNTLIPALSATSPDPSVPAKFIDAHSSPSTTKGGGKRDQILDFLRGIAIFSMVTDHLLFTSGYSYLTRERVGVVTGAEFFVLISGVLIGHLYKQKISRVGFTQAAGALIRRAVQLYFVCIAIVFGVFLFSLIPGVDTKLATPWGMYNLRGAIHDYGIFKTIGHSLMLKCGPLRMNVIGVYVVLLAGAPIAMWLLTRGRTMLLLILSGLAWAVNLKLQARVSHTLFDSVFRVVSWQFLFVIGMTAGYHRKQLRDFLLTSRGKLSLFLAAIICALLCVFALHNPNMELADAARLHWIPKTTFEKVYKAFFSRKVLAPGRILNVICLFGVGYVVIREYWAFVNKWAGWFFVTIGSASLYVYILHVFLLQGIYQIPYFNEENLVLNTVSATAVMLLLWGMTKKKVLFWLIPR